MDVDLKSQAKKIRLLALMSIYQAKSGHPGSSLSSADILTALYFIPILKIDKANAFSQNRDYFILSNGHACPAWYAVLSQLGFIQESELVNLRKFGHFLQGHPDKSKFPLVESTTGSLGQGITVGLGLAMGLKNLKKDNRVYVLESDGEQDEGSVWEVNRIAAHYQLDNLKVIIDRNKMQIDGPTEKQSALEPLDEKYKSFGWFVKKINGHDFSQLKSGLNEIKQVKGQPAVLIAETIRGKGVSFMEQSVLYHAKTLTEEEYNKAKNEIEKND
ncbi:transketolase [Candidatus Microgenomates bacterium]|nr:transketolase [Candidatus Microgenomates bacterium]